MAGLESTLNKAQKESLSIENFVFHIIDPDLETDDKFIYLGSL